MKKWFFLLALLTSGASFAQTDISLTSSIGELVLSGSYSPNGFQPSNIIDDPSTILADLRMDISPDSLQYYIEKLQSFHTRHSASDTLSPTQGIGAARSWILSKFQQFSGENEGRLIPAYLKFRQNICGVYQHKNVCGILPGLDTTSKDILVVEAHFDSRCNTSCDNTCFAPGADDNASGSALVIELARVMSRFAFDRTIIFTTVTGEEQGLHGGRAWALYLEQNNIDVLSCLNNDIVGGVECGTTSSPPSCDVPGAIDSTSVRIFSYTQNNDTNGVSPHKQLARYIKLQQNEEINPHLTQPMELNMQIREDRVGRGGDHIPFRESNFTAIRFTSEHEHGNGSGLTPDRQHTTDDVIGEDTNSVPDGIIDRWHVDFNYLARNAIMNGSNLALLAHSPPMTQLIHQPLSDGVEIKIQGADTAWQHYRVGIRRSGSGSLYFDEVRTFTNTHKLMVTGLTIGETYYFSVASVNGEGVESLWAEEFPSLVTGGREPNLRWGTVLGPAYPNPASHQTSIEITTFGVRDYDKAELVFMDLTGREIDRQAVDLHQNSFKVTYHNRAGYSGMFLYSLVIDGEPVQTRKMLLMR